MLPAQPDRRTGRSLTPFRSPRRRLRLQRPAPARPYEARSRRHIPALAGRGALTECADLDAVAHDVGEREAAGDVGDAGAFGTTGGVSDVPPLGEVAVAGEEQHVGTQPAGPRQAQVAAEA